MRRSTLTFIIVVVLVVFGGLIALKVHQRIERAGKVAVAVYVLPKDAILTINGSPQHEGTLYLRPGDYSITVSKSGFGNSSRTYSVDPSIAHPLINVILPPESASARMYYAQNNDLYLQREGLGSEQAHQQSSLIINKNPLTAQLPYSNLVYTIGYRSDTSDSTGQSIIIEIDAPTGSRNAAVEQIRKFGYDPSDYKINFESYTNPFAS